MLPRFNLAAFLMPPIWGPAHGQWVGALFLPIWLFADSAIASAVRMGGAMWIAAVLVAAGTLGVPVLLRAARERRRVSPSDRARERRGVPAPPAPVGDRVACRLRRALLAWAIWFDLVVAARPLIGGIGPAVTPFRGDAPGWIASSC